MKTIFVFLFVTIYCGNNFCFADEMTVKIVDATINTDLEYFTKPLINLPTPQRPTVDFESSAVQQIDEPFLNVNLLIDSPKGYQPFLQTHKQSLCGFFKEPEKFPLLKLVFDDLKKYGNFSTSCPIKKGFYVVHDFQIDASQIPPMAPAGKYRLDIDMYVIKDGVEKNIYDAKFSSVIEKK